MSELVVYSMEGCASCVSAAKLLTSKGIKHIVIKVDEDLIAARFIQSKGHRSLPVIYEGDTLYAGSFTELQKKLAS